MIVMTVGFDTFLIHQAMGAAAILVATYILGQIVTRILRTGLRKAGVYQAETIVVASVAKYFIYVMGLLVVLGYVGIPITSILVGFVVVALILGFAARNAMENLAAWYVLRTWNPFDVGDLIMIEGITGVVREYDPLRTTIETHQQSNYSIPNIKILQSALYNFGRYGEDFPVDFQLKVPRTEDLEELKLRIVDIVGRYSQLSRNRPVQVMVDDLSEDKVLLRVNFFVPEFGLVMGAKDYVLSWVQGLHIGERLSQGKTRGIEMEESSGDVSALAASPEGPKCRMCDSNRWDGYLMCKSCRSYYVNGKCHECDQIRLEKCPLDGGDLEYVPPIL